GAERTGALQMLQQRRDAGGPRYHQGSLPAFQSQRSEEPRKAVEVVAMQVRDQHRIQARERKPRAQRRDLRSFAAVAENPRALGGDGKRGGAAQQCGAAGAGTERDELQPHPCSSTTAPRPWNRRRSPRSSEPPESSSGRHRPSGNFASDGFGSKAATMRSGPRRMSSVFPCADARTPWRESFCSTGCSRRSLKSARCQRSASSSLRERSIRLRRKVSSANGSGTSLHAKPLNSSWRPLRIASTRAGSVCETKYWNGSRAAHSSPWKYSGSAGCSAITAAAARRPPSPVSPGSRPPPARSPT